MIHLLALKPYKKPEILARLHRDGVNQKDKNSLGVLLQQVRLAPSYCVAVLLLLMQGHKTSAHLVVYEDLNSLTRHQFSSHIGFFFNFAVTHWKIYARII